jgi:hypothetical protein
MTKCPKCQGAMETGFIPDCTQGGFIEGRWTEGQPEKGFLGGIKVSGKRQIVITTDRCTKCGYLESYAMP